MLSLKSHRSREEGEVSFQREHSPGLRHRLRYPQPCGATKMAVQLLLCGAMTFHLYQAQLTVIDSAWDFHWEVSKLPCL